MRIAELLGDGRQAHAPVPFGVVGGGDSVINEDRPVPVAERESGARRDHQQPANTLAQPPQAAFRPRSRDDTDRRR